MAKKCGSYRRMSPLFTENHGADHHPRRECVAFRQFALLGGLEVGGTTAKTACCTPARTFGREIPRAGRVLLLL